ncbi:MAG: hypothetical protein DCC66_08630 [Planctomycetota bacterium]|nr:MAG: hypothetical protein DCC66_08630 [Planctomycetota bacterium]
MASAPPHSAKNPIIGPMASSSAGRTFQSAIRFACPRPKPTYDPAPMSNDAMPSVPSRPMALRR